MPLTDEEIAAIYNDPARGLKGMNEFIRQLKGQAPASQIRRVLQGLDTYAVNAARFRPREQRRVVVRKYLDTVGMDLADMQRVADENDGYRFILVGCDVLSGMCYAQPLRDKTAKSTAAALRVILRGMPKAPTHIWTDDGGEFGGPFKKLCEDRGITLYHTQNEGKSVFAERMIKTLKGRIGRGADARGNWRWVDRLQEYVRNINETVHSVSKHRPIDVSEANEEEVARTRYRDVDDPRVRVVRQAQALTAKPKFKVGDLVRISLLKTDRFAKESQVHRWSRQPFWVTAVSAGPPTVLYTLADVLPGPGGPDGPPEEMFRQGEELKGQFYESELAPWRAPEEYRIVIKERRGRRVLVGYLGFDDSFDQWLPASQVRDVQ